MLTYHRDLGFPPNLRVPHGKCRLNYSKHAIDEANSDKYGKLTLPPEIFIDRSQVVEVDVLDGRVVKAVVRQPYDTKRDIVYVVTNSGFVKTVWCNLASDTHTSLNPNRYAKP